jgi:hypothetical protein
MGRVVVARPTLANVRGIGASPLVIWVVVEVIGMISFLSFLEFLIRLISPFLPKQLIVDQWVVVKGLVGVFIPVELKWSA